MASRNTTNRSQSSDTLLIRVGEGQILIAFPFGERINSNQTEVFTMKSGMSVSANLREAYKTCTLLQEKADNALLLIDAPTLLIPSDEFREKDIPLLFGHVFTGYEHYAKGHVLLPDLHCAVVYAMEKDVHTVMADHTATYQVLPISVPVWKYLHQHASGQNRRKLFAYFHDGKTDVFSFRQNRFLFANTFKVNNEHDALYFLLYTWSQLRLDSEKDELHLLGDVLNRRWLNERLKLYLRRPYFDSIESMADKMAPSCPSFPADVQALADIDI